jgi:uncharacterized protein
MEQMLAKFVHALRNAEVEVTPAETLDALAVLNCIDCSDRALFKDALALTLAKSITDKARFSICFDTFFSHLAFNKAPQNTLLNSFDHAAMLEFLKTHTSPQVVALVERVLSGDRSELARHLQEQSRLAGVDEMSALRDKSRVVDRTLTALGVPLLIQAQESYLVQNSDSAIASGIGYLLHYLREETKNYVDVHYDLVANKRAGQVVREAALQGELMHIPAAYEREIDLAIEQFAQRLQYKFKRRKQAQRRGTMDFRRMIRQNVAYDGHFFKLAWRHRKREQASVFVVCDVSGSVARLSRFLLLLLHRLSDVLPNVRSFAFSSQLGEVTEYFDTQDPARAVEAVLFDWGNGLTDYGRALLEFRQTVGADLNSKATVIFVGDARNNQFNPQTLALKEIAQRARQVIWFNPEAPENWGEGDSEMLRYTPFCLAVKRLSSLQDLKRITQDLVNLGR